MTTKYSPGITIQETQTNIPQPIVAQGMVTCALINSDKGEGDKVFSLFSIDDLVEFAGEPNEYNYLNWFNLRDFLVAGKQLNVIRAIPTDAKNASIKLNGISHLESNTAWYDGTTVKSLEKPSADFYNKDVAEFSIDQSFTTTSKLQILNKFVTAKQNLAVSVCSSADHYESPIFNERVDVISKFDWYQAPTTPVDDERYKITRNSATVTSTLDGDAGVDTITVTGDYSEIVASSKIYIEMSTDTGSFISTSIDSVYSQTTGNTILTFLTGTLTASSQTGSISYLTGDWKTSEFEDDEVVEYTLATTTWTVLSPATNEKYYVGSLGQIWYYTGSAWVQDVDSDYLPVDANGDGKYEYAVKNIFDPTLYNSDNSLKSFKDIYKDNLTFANQYSTAGIINYDEVLVFVFVKNESNDLWYLHEQHLGSYISTARDANNNPFHIERIVMDDSALIYVKVGEVNEYTASSDTLAITANVETSITDDNSANVAKVFTFVGQDISANMVIGKQFSLSGCDTTGMNTEFTIVSFDYNVTTSLATVVTVLETPVESYTFDATVDEKIHLSTNTITLQTDLQNWQVGEKINYTDLPIDSTDTSGLLTIAEISYSSPTTTIVTEEDLLLFAIESGTSIDDTYSGKVSTNMNKYSDVTHASYDIANDNASDGFSASDMLIYDSAPTNTSGDSITDYSDMETSDMDSSAEYFLDKDNIRCDLLISYQTSDEFSNYHQDKMAQIAAIRGRCSAIVTPMDQTMFLGNTTDTITTNLITEFGNQRASLYNGTFTAFGKYANVETCTMKYYEDTYNNKYRWTSLSGDLARLIVTQDSTVGKGVWYPTANEDGQINNAIKLAFIPNEDQRELLNMNGINTVFKTPSMNYPVKFSNLTSYRTEGLFKVESYRHMLNKIETFITDVVYTKYFKFKDDQLYKNMKDSINTFLEGIKNTRGLVSYNFDFPVIANEPSNTVTMNLDLVPTGVVEHFILNVHMTEQGVTIETSEA